MIVRISLFFGQRTSYPMLATAYIALVLIAAIVAAVRIAKSKNQK
jgi:hypothetical protein